MSDMMTLIVSKTTDNVLAVATRRGDPATAIAPELLVGDGLEIRNPVSGAVLLKVEPTELAIKTAQGVEDLLLQPRIYALKDGLPVVGASGVGIVANTTSVTVSFAALPAEAKVWVQVEGGTPLLRLTQSATAAAGATSLVLNMTLQAGTPYQILALVQGNQAAIEAQTPV